MDRTHDYDDLRLDPPTGVEYPVAREELRGSRHGAGAWVEYLALRAAQKAVGVV